MGAVGGGGGGTRILALKRFYNFRQTFSSLCPSCVKILPTSYMKKKESLDKEKPCNVVLNIYIYLYIFFLYIYSCYNLNKCYVSPFFFLQLKNEFK